MALPENTPSNEVIVHVSKADISTAGSVYAPCPVRGKLVRGFSAISGAIATADCTWSVEVNGVAVTGTATIANASSAAGDVDEVAFSGAATNVNQGDTLEVIVGGESDNTIIGEFALVIRT